MPRHAAHRVTRLAARPWTRGLATLGGVVALGVLAFVERRTLYRSLDVFDHLRWHWVLVAVLAETASMVAFGLAQRHLVVVGGHETPVGHAVRTAYAGNAISGSVPFVGSQVGTVFTFRAYRQHGVDGPTVAWALAVAGVLSAIAYGIVAGTGAALAGDSFVTGAIAGSSTAMLVGAAIGWWMLRRPSMRPRVTRHVVRIVTWRERVTKRSLGNAHEVVAVAFERFDALRPQRADYARVFGYTFVNTIADVSALGLCVLAVGAGVPWTRLILVWVAGSTAKGIALTPGGVGFVEGAIAVALVAAGVPAPQATAAALLYRFVSYWMLVGIGWLIVGGRRLRATRAQTDERNRPIVNGGVAAVAREGREYVVSKRP